MGNIIFDVSERLSAIATRLTEIATIAMTCILVLALFLQVVSRYFFGETIIWTEELALLMFTWIVLLGGTLGVRKKFHARITFIADISNERVKVALEKLTDVLVIMLSVFMMNAGIAYFHATRGSYSAAVEYPLEWLYVSVPIAGALMLIHSVAALLGPVKSGERIDA